MPSRSVAFPLLVLVLVLAAPAPAFPQAMPPDQAALCRAVEAGITQYRAAISQGLNQLKRTNLRTARKRAIQQALGSLKVSGWVGNVASMGTTSDGLAYVAVLIPCGATIKTWNNGLSDIGDSTLIRNGSALYNAVADLSDKQAVTFSGRFVAAEEDHVKESSITESGSMTDPEFIFRFAAIAPR